MNTPSPQRHKKTDDNASSELFKLAEKYLVEIKGLAKEVTSAVAAMDGYVKELAEAKATFKNSTPKWWMELIKYLSPTLVTLAFFAGLIYLASDSGCGWKASLFKLTIDGPPCITETIKKPAQRP